MTPPNRPSSPRRAARALVVLAALTLSLVAAGVVASPAAASACGEKVINDWWDGRIDGTYPLPCYDDAIEQLPRDMRDYSSAPDDIERAMQAAMRGEKAPPNKGGPPRTGTTTTDTTPGATPPTGPDDPTPTGTIAAPDDSGSSASSVPIPLLILGGLALLLVAAGSAGYIVRRVQARRLPPPNVT